jgi:hypothetical protein
MAMEQQVVHAGQAAAGNGADSRGGALRRNYTVYKPAKSGKGGAMRFDLNAQTPAVFVEAARQLPDEERRFDWESKVVMKWGPNDIGEILAVLDRVQGETKLFHQTDKGNTAFELKLQGDRTPATFFATLSRQRADTKEVDRLGISVSLGEAAVLAALLRHAALVLAGWSS